VNQLTDSPGYLIDVMFFFLSLFFTILLMRHVVKNKPDLIFLTMLNVQQNHPFDAPDDDNTTHPLKFKFLFLHFVFLLLSLFCFILFLYKRVVDYLFRKSLIA